MEAGCGGRIRVPAQQTFPASRHNPARPHAGLVEGARWDRHLLPDSRSGPRRGRGCVELALDEPWDRCGGAGAAARDGRAWDGMYGRTNPWHVSACA